jgi:hypothetical protein
LQGIDGKAAQIIAQVTQGIQIPVVPVMPQALRLNNAVIDFDATAIPCLDFNAFALQQCLGNIGKKSRLD